MSVIQLAPIHICVGSPSDGCPPDAVPLDDGFRWQAGSGPRGRPCDNPALVRVNGICTPPQEVPIGALVPADFNKAQVLADALVTSYVPDLGVYGTGYDVARAGAFKQLFKADTRQLELLKQASLDIIDVGQDNLQLIRLILGKAVVANLPAQITKYRKLEQLEIERIKEQRALVLNLRRVLVLKYNGILPSDDLVKAMNDAGANLKAIDQQQEGLGVLPAAALPVTLFLAKWLGITIIAAGGTYAMFAIISQGMTKVQNALNISRQLQEAQNEQLKIHNDCLNHRVNQLKMTPEAAFQSCQHLEKIDPDQFRQDAEKALFTNFLKDIAVYGVIGVGLYVTVPFFKELLSSKAKQLSAS